MSQQVVEQWKQGGPGRKLLVNMMVSCGGDRAMFKQKLDVIESMSRKSTNTITAGWYSKEKMDKVLGWSKWGSKLHPFNFPSGARRSLLVSMAHPF